MSDERHACLAALTAHAVGPDAGLGFADVGFVEEYHAQAALAYSASDREGKRTFEQAAMEEEALAVFLALQSQLALQSLGIYADTHAAELDAPAQGGIPASHH